MFMGFSSGPFKAELTDVLDLVGGTGGGVDGFTAVGGTGLLESTTDGPFIGRITALLGPAADVVGPTVVTGVILGFG